MYKGSMKIKPWLPHTWEWALCKPIETKDGLNCPGSKLCFTKKKEKESIRNAQVYKPRKKSINHLSRTVANDPSYHL